MQVFLIEKVGKASFLKKIFKPIEIKEDRILLNCEDRNLKFYKKNKIVKNIRKILGFNNKIILSKDLKQDKDFENLLYSNGFDIIKGRKLFKLLINELIDNICKENKIKSEEARISITINEVNSFAVKLIEDLSKKFKMLNIVTNHINHFKKMEEQLWTENGIIITVTNNKRKALIKSDIILNVDFPEEGINRYAINDNGILINLEEKVKIKKKRFNGKIINEYKIKLRKGSNIAFSLEKVEYEKYDLEDLAEIYIMNHPDEIQDVIISK